MTSSNGLTLPQITTRLHRLEKQNVANILETGRLLELAFASFEYGDHAEFYKWADETVGIHGRMVRRFRAAWEFGQNVRTDGCKFGRHDLDKCNLSKTALYDLVELAASCEEPDDSDIEVVKEALAMAAKGRVTPAVIEDISDRQRQARVAKDAAERAAALAQDKLDHPENYVEPPSEVEEPEVEVESDPEPEVESTDDEEPEVEPEHEPPAELLEALETLINNRDEYSEDDWTAAVREIGGYVAMRGIIATLTAAIREEGGSSVKSAADRAEAQAEAKRLRQSRDPQGDAIAARAAEEEKAA
jgi:hypothetical protein